MNHLSIFERILRGQCKIDPTRYDVEGHKLLQLAKHMRDSLDTDPLTLTAAMSFLCSQRGGAEAVNLMLDTTPVDVNRSCVSYGESIKQFHHHISDRLIPPLHIAIEHDNLNVVRVLLQQTTDSQLHHGKRRLECQYIDVNIKNGRHCNSSSLLRATHKAAGTRPSAIQVEIIKLLLQQQGIDARQADSSGNTPLSIACYNGNIDVVRLLLDHEKNLMNHYDDRLHQPLLNACCYYHYGFPGIIWTVKIWTVKIWTVIIWTVLVSLPI
jgi:hypothetical protein